MTRFTLTIPTVANDGTPAPEYPARAERYLSAAGFSGWTAHDGEGVWHSTADDYVEVVLEDGTTDTRRRAVTVVYREPVRVFTLDAHEGRLEALQAVAERLAVDCAQEAVYLTAQPITAYLIEPARTPPVYEVTH